MKLLGGAFAILPSDYYWQCLAEEKVEEMHPDVLSVLSMGQLGSRSVFKVHLVDQRRFECPANTVIVRRLRQLVEYRTLMKYGNRGPRPKQRLHIFDTAIRGCSEECAPGSRSLDNNSMSRSADELRREKVFVNQDYTSNEHLLKIGKRMDE